MVVWILGVSGSGKSFLAKKLYKKLKIKFKKIIWVDGDKFRKKYSKDLKYSIKDRRENSKRIQKYCSKYEKKNYLVICYILSIFPNHQKKNREIFKNYIQIQIDANINKIKKRNNKKIYSKKVNVVGKDLKFPKPYKSDVNLKNNFDQKFEKKISKIETLIKKRLFQSLMVK